MIEVGTPVVKTVYWIQTGPRRSVVTDAELRKHREQKGLETPVVYAVNDVHSLSPIGLWATGVSELTREMYHLESIVARPKLKEPAGHLSDLWSMLFNSTIREEPYHI
jgi:hypothetical protein